MAEYIEREAAVNLLRAEAGRGATPYHIGLYAAARAVEAIPAADVRPVVRNEKKILDVTCGDIAEHMTLETACILVKALFEHFWQEPSFQYTIEKMAEEGEA